MNVFEPVRRQPPSAFRACVFIDPNASLPAPGSVSAQAPIFSIVMTGRANRSFCASVPRERMAPPQSPREAPNASANPGQTRDSSIIRMAMSGDSPPAPPSAPPPPPSRILANWARTMLTIPNVAPSSRISGYGRSSPLSSRATFGARCPVAHERIAFCATLCSSVKSSIGASPSEMFRTRKIPRLGPRGKSPGVDPDRVDLGRVPRDVLDLCERLRAHGKRAWIVGGCVRDLFLGRAASDWDVATDARPKELVAIFPRAIPTGIEHGTVTVVKAGRHYEVTTLRGEGTYSDGRRPDWVTFVDEITADLARRDFTVNAIALDPLDGKVIDPHAGRGDLERGILRAVGDPKERFAEDGLRVLRAARFVATLELSLDPETEAAIRPTLDTYRKVAAERVRDEWVKTMKARLPSRAFEVMQRTGILDVTCPALLEGVDMQQNRWHAYDVWRHGME